VTAPDRAAAVEIVADVVRPHASWPSMTGHNVVAALDAAGWLHDPTYAAALEAVAAAARAWLDEFDTGERDAGFPARQAQRIEALRGALDAVPAAETGEV